MKKFFVLCCSAGLLLAAGCSSDKVTPEEVGENYMEKRFAGAEADLKDLNYTVVDAGEDAATVMIEGTISYKEEIYLKLKNGKWVVTDEKPEGAQNVAEAAVEEGHAAPVEEAHAAPAPEEEEADAHAAPVKTEADTHAAPANAEDDAHAAPAEAEADTHAAPAKAEADAHAAPAEKETAHH